TLLARGGVLESAQLIKLIEAYQNETNEAVWNILFLALGELRKFVENDPEAEKALRQLSGQVASIQYDRLGWDPKENEPEEDAKLRATVISLTLYSENEQALARAKE